MLGVLAWLPASAQAPATSVATQSDPMTVVLDASTAPRGFMTTHMRIPVRPGPFTLVYPQWIPGEHGPTGPLGDLADLRVSANGAPIPWSRDTVNMYAFHIDVPPGVTHVDAEFTAIVNAPGDVMGTRNIA
ncbi:MAG: peptidase M61, partial [Vulcanimicrobiaceae bacterium]